MLLGPGITQNWRLRLKRYWASTLLMMATAGWMAVSMIILGSSDPPAPDPGVPPVPFLGHLFLFGVLGLLVSVSMAALAHSKGWFLDLGVAVLVGILWGIFTEWYQTRVPGRDANLADFLTDVVGAFVGGAMVWVFRLWASHRHGAV